MSVLTAILNRLYDTVPDENYGDSRYWYVELDEINLEDMGHPPYGEDTVGIVDENEGGIVAYVHRVSAEKFIEALNVRTNLREAIKNGH